MTGVIFMGGPGTGGQERCRLFPVERVETGRDRLVRCGQKTDVEDADLAAKLDAKRIADAKVVLEKDAGVMEKL